MACGVVVGIWLLLVQAEHGCSWATAAPSSQNAAQRVGFQQPDGRLRTLGGPPQTPLRQVVSSPRSTWWSSSSARAAADGGFGSGPSPNTEAASQTELSPEQSRLLSKPNQQEKYSSMVKVQTRTQFGSASLPKGASVAPDHQNWRDRTGTGLFQSSLHLGKPPPSSSESGSGSSAKSPSFRAQQDPSGSLRRQASASLFSPVGPAPPGHRVWMQTYARAPARKRTLQSGAKAARLSSETAIPRSRPGSETGPKPAGSYKPKILTVERPAPGFVPAEVYDIPQPFGGWAIRRLGHSDQNQVEVQKPRLRPAPPPDRTQGPQQKDVKAKVPSLHPESKWSRVKLRPKL